ncbi:MAG: hypothetical protein ACP5PP_06525 [Fervidobacterium sp.]
MQRYLIFFTLFILAVSSLIFSSSVEKVYIGIKYSFRNFRTDGTVILVDPINKNMVVYDLELKQILNLYKYIGSYVINSFPIDDGYIIIDRVGQKISKISFEGWVINGLSFPRRIQQSLFQDNSIYVLLEGGELNVFDTDLNKKFSYNFSGSPTFLFLWNGKIFVTYLWNDNFDVEFVGEKPRKIGLTTPSILVKDMLVDTRGGQLYNLGTGKIVKLAPYISSADFDGSAYYVSSMSNQTIYVVQNDSVVYSFKVPYTPTAVKKIGENIVILSASGNKVMVTNDGKDIKVFDTGDYPLEVFPLNDSQNSFAVYCSDSGEMYYYKF